VEATAPAEPASRSQACRPANAPEKSSGGTLPVEATASAESPSRQPVSPRLSTRPGVRPPVARHPGANDGAALSSTNTGCATEHAPVPHPRVAPARPSSASRRPVSLERRRSAGSGAGTPRALRRPDSQQRVADSPRSFVPVRSQSARSQGRRPQSARSARAADQIKSHHHISDSLPIEEAFLDLVPPQRAAVHALEWLAAEDEREKEARLNKQSQIRAWIQRKDAERAVRRQAEKEEAQVASEQERFRQQRQEDREAEMARQKIARLQAHARRQQELVSDLERAKIARTRDQGGSSCKATMAVALAAYASPRPPCVTDRRR